MKKIKRQEKLEQKARQFLRKTRRDLDKDNAAIEDVIQRAGNKRSKKVVEGSEE